MAVSLEARVPLLDHVLADYVNALPISYKLSMRQSKRVLRHAMRDVLPEPVLRRSKKGFAPPLWSWLSGPLREWSRQVLLESCPKVFDETGRESRSLSPGRPRPRLQSVPLDPACPGCLVPPPTGGVELKRVRRLGEAIDSLAIWPMRHRASSRSLSQRICGDSGTPAAPCWESAAGLVSIKSPPLWTGLLPSGRRSGCPASAGSWYPLPRLRVVRVGLAMLGASHSAG